MGHDLTELDAHEQPSDFLRGIWKAVSRTDGAALLSGEDIDDFAVPEKAADFVVVGSVPSETLMRGFGHLHTQADEDSDHQGIEAVKDALIYVHPLLPGLLIFPSIVPPKIQRILLSKLIHRDLSVPTHQTNLHLHYDLPYPDSDSSGDDKTSDDAGSFFSLPPDSPARFQPKDPAVHKPLTVKQVLDRRLHWVTLGGQYDWTNRVYPSAEPPRFPADVAGFLEAVFPDTLAQAAIVNFYTPGDTMMMHRDVSEETDRGLVSISLGCDALFMIAPSNVDGDGGAGETRSCDDEDDGEKEDKKVARKREYLLLRLRSGDAIYMTKESRYAWHGVPKVLKGTCPEYLADWPAEEGGRFEAWRGWMRNKRINLNVRQMRE